MQKAIEINLVIVVWCVLKLGEGMVYKSALVDSICFCNWYTASLLGVEKEILPFFVAFVDIRCIFALEQRGIEQ